MSDVMSTSPDQADSADGGPSRRATPDGTVTAPPGQDPDRIIVRNEFAAIGVSLRDPGGRPRLCVEDLRTGRTTELDAIELESLAWARHADLAPLLDPSLTRWAPGCDD